MLKKKKNVYSNFLGYLTKKGKKVSAKKVIDCAFLKVSKKLNIPVYFVLIKIFIKLNTFVEIKKNKKKRSKNS